MGKFPKIKQWLTEAENDKVTVLYPGGFKPLTGGHISMIEKYDKHPEVKEVRVIVGPKTRNGISQELGVKIAKELTSHLPNVKIETTKYPSPLLTAYKEIETAQPGKYALAASSKGDDYKRVIDFTEQHQPGGKYYDKVPKGVSVVELPVNTDPALFLRGPHKGQPISASTLRADIMKGDYEGFDSGYPLNNEKQIRKVWDMLQGIVVNESYINEGTITKDKNTHMTHAEDLIILNGAEGLDWVLSMMKALFNELKGQTSESQMKLSVKIDGAPAVMAWSKFPGLEDNGIAMKGLFSKTPKYYTTTQQIEDEQGDRPDLAYKLKTFLNHLPSLDIPAGEIWQGDFLFDDKSIQKTTIDGKAHWAFHPNTIYYVVPVDSDLGKTIGESKVGIVWHTRYTGDDIASVKANYNADVTELAKSRAVFMTDPYVKSFAGLITFTEKESDYITRTIAELEERADVMGQMPLLKDAEHTELKKLFAIFQNTLIKSRARVAQMDPEDFVAQFVEFLEQRAVIEAEKRKSPAGKEKVMATFAGMIDDVQQMHNDMIIIVDSILEVTKMKEMFVKKLSAIGEFQTYLKMKDGEMRQTGQEGFACSDISGDVVKLVDREEFSWSNFSPDVVKGWESTARK